MQVPTYAGPSPGAEQSSSLYLYRSTVNPTRHENSGLVGPIVVTRKGDADADGRPKGVDREIITVFQVFNEIETEYIAVNSKSIEEQVSLSPRCVITYQLHSSPFILSRATTRSAWP